MAQFRKAIAAGFSTGALVYATFAGSGGHVDFLIQLGAAIGAGVVAGAIVYFTPNAPAAPKPAS